MQDSSRPQLAERFEDLVQQLNRHLHSGSREDWQASAVTVSQIKTLSALEHAGSLRIGQVARHLQSTLSATSTIVDRLVNKGLVTRGPDPSDRRVVVCELTREGQETVSAFWRVDPTRIAVLLERLDGPQLAAVVGSLETLCGAVEESSTAD
jgi:DNA-binding MarR family transcriptional regulator